MCACKSKTGPVLDRNDFKMNWFVVYMVLSIICLSVTMVTRQGQVTEVKVLERADDASVEEREREQEMNSSNC